MPLQVYTACEACGYRARGSEAGEDARAEEALLASPKSAEALPSPATHAILIQLKAGDTVHPIPICSVYKTLLNSIVCIRHFWTLYRVSKTLLDARYGV